MKQVFLLGVSSGIAIHHGRDWGYRTQCGISRIEKNLEMVVLDAGTFEYSGSILIDRLISFRLNLS